MLRGLWKPDEDALLSATVAVHGARDWVSVARKMGTRRIPKQCRERWVNHLDPSLKREPFSQREDQIIIDMYELLGPVWARISLALPGRSDHQVKNRWYVLDPYGRRKEQVAARFQRARAPLQPPQPELTCEEEVASLLHASPAQALRDPDLLPKRATTTVMRRVVIVSSPTGCRGVGLGTFSPFQGINSMLRLHTDARNDAWDGLPRHFAALS